VFLALSVVGAVLAVATPVLAGRVVDAIDTGGPPGRVIGIAVLIAVIAVAEAGLGVVARWFSARIGEGLILDLRRRCSRTSSACRWRSSRAPAPARW
jgi:ATP-binding cassette subfamily C protein